MLRKDKLAARLTKIREIKSNLVPLLDKHVASSLFFSDMEQAKREKILDGLRKSVKKQLKHIEILNGLTKEIGEVRRDVY